MTPIRRFEDLRCWQLSNRLVVKVNKRFLTQVPGNKYAIKDQSQRAALSIMNNIAEGFNRKSTKEFIRYLEIAIGSANELKSMLHVSYQSGYIDRKLHAEISKEVETVKIKMYKLIKHLRSRAK